MVPNSYHFKVSKSSLGACSLNRVSMVPLQVNWSYSNGAGDPFSTKDDKRRGRKESFHFGKEGIEKLGWIVAEKNTVLLLSLTGLSSENSRW